MNDEHRKPPPVEKTDGRKKPQKLPHAWMANEDMRKGAIAILKGGGTVPKVGDYVRQKGHQVPQGTLNRFVFNMKGEQHGPTAFLSFLENFSAEDLAKVSGLNTGRFGTRRSPRVPRNQRERQARAMQELKTTKVEFSKEDYEELQSMLDAIQSSNEKAVSGKYFKLRFAKMLDKREEAPPPFYGRRS